MNLGSLHSFYREVATTIDLAGVLLYYKRAPPFMLLVVWLLRRLAINEVPLEIRLLPEHAFGEGGGRGCSLVVRWYRQTNKNEARPSQKWGGEREVGSGSLVALF